MKHYAIASRERHAYDEMSHLLRSSDPECDIQRVKDASEAYQIARNLDVPVSFIECERLSVASDFFDYELLGTDPCDTLESRIYELKQYMIHHLDEQLKLPDLANRMYVTPNYLATRFKQLEGETIMEFLERQRMDAAKKELEMKTTRISQIALDVGYPNVSYFSKVFRKHFDVAPREYRRQAQFMREQTKKKK